MMQTTVAERYGRAPRARRRRLALGLVAAAGGLAIVVAWIVWVGLFTPSPSLETRDLGYTNDNPDDSVDVRFEVTVDAGTPASCALQALNDKFAIVGWKIVDLPPGDQRTRVFEENVRVTEPAVTGLIYRCWLT